MALFYNTPLHVGTSQFNQSKFMAVFKHAAGSEWITTPTASTDMVVEACL